ncbi:MAG: ATP-binding protein [Synergistaceae bacterium]|jgi:DNA transposition AAA+ family ATPase|nr:ATP-binding protein [Synergistaceae bacterium]
MQEQMERLQNIVQALGLSNMDIARISGKSTGTVSQVMSQKYRGRPEVVGEILAALEAYEVRMTSEMQEAHDAAKWATEGQRLIQTVLHLTYETQGFSVVVGPSGIGKTYTAEDFLARHPGRAQYLRCADGMCMGDVIDALLELTGTPGYGSNSQKLKRAIRALKDQDVRMILVDEADLLVTDGSKPKILKKISVFREVKEAGIAVSLIGLDSFDTALRAVGETYVTSRIDLYRHAGNPTQAELAHYLAYLGHDPETEGGRLAVSLAPKNGSMRFVSKAAQIAKQLSGNMMEALRLLFAASGHVKGA